MNNTQNGGAGLASLTFFSHRRSLFFISLLYFSDSLLGRGVSLWYIHKKESILEGADADRHADPVEKSA